MKKYLSIFFKCFIPEIQKIVPQKLDFTLSFLVLFYSYLLYRINFHFLLNFKKFAVIVLYLYQMYWISIFTIIMLYLLGKDEDLLVGDLHLVVQSLHGLTRPSGKNKFIVLINYHMSNYCI